MSIQSPSPKRHDSCSSSSSSFSAPPFILERIEDGLVGKVVSFLDLKSALRIDCLDQTWHYRMNNVASLIMRQIRLVSELFRRGLSLEMIGSDYNKKLVGKMGSLRAQHLEGEAKTLQKEAREIHEAFNRTYGMQSGFLCCVLQDLEGSCWDRVLDSFNEFNQRALVLLLGNSRKSAEGFFPQNKINLLEACYSAYSASEFDFEVDGLSSCLEKILQDNEASANLSQQDLCLALVMLDSVITEQDLSTVFLKMAKKLRHSFLRELDPVGVCRLSAILRKKGITSSDFYEKIAQVGEPWNNSDQKFLYRLALICMNEMADGTSKYNKEVERCTTHYIFPLPTQKQYIEIYEKFLLVVFKHLRRVGLSKLSSEECADLVLSIHFSFETRDKTYDDAAIVALVAQRLAEIGMPGLSAADYCVMVKAFDEASAPPYNANIPPNCFKLLRNAIYYTIDGLKSHQAIDIAYFLLKHVTKPAFVNKLADRLLSLKSKNELEFENDLDSEMCIQVIRNFYSSGVRNKKLFDSLAFILGKKMEPLCMPFKQAAIQLDGGERKFLRKVFLEKGLAVDREVHTQLYSQLYGDGDEEMYS